ncbi:UDP-glucuronosyltransferase 1-1 [Desmophyllum pertusum]|uniref:UDP-glucuronosyltransferase 1-1 n=1 Tax=Desmophyllum pertusum TaxID=174260 RepID=A0A9W9YMX5_9CNID|nr:UDP-glucuronosyltransferase 1-1 [Desmophyllum pertusum]
MMINERQKIACDSLLNDTELLQDLTNFDLIVHEHFAFCSVLVAELLGIPRVIIVSDSPNSGLSPYFKIPLPVSYVPSRFSSFTDKMSFIERLVNLGMHIFSQVVSHVLFARSMSPLKDRYNITPEISYHEAFGNAELVIFHADFAFEYAQPLLPVISKEKIDVLATAFGNLNQKVIWKLKGYIPSFLSPHIKIVEWLPQNDLLAHKDIKAFVSHVGHNSVYESAYHGVPVVAVPIYADQFPNAKRVEHFGLGVAVDHKSVTAQELFEAIELVVNEPRY